MSSDAISYLRGLICVRRFLLSRLLWAVNWTEAEMKTSETQVWWCGSRGRGGDVWGARGPPGSQLEVLRPGNLASPDPPRRPVSKWLFNAGLSAFHCAARTAALGRPWGPRLTSAGSLRTRGPRAVPGVRPAGALSCMGGHSSGRLTHGMGCFQSPLYFGDLLTK